MPANKSTHSTPSKENANNKLSNGTNGRKSLRKQHRKQHRNHHHLVLHSEYRSTYTWHEFTGPSTQEQHTVVRRAPQPPSKSLFRDANAMLQSSKPNEDANGEGTCMEPPLPRRKKCPELAYRHHEFIPTAPAPVVVTTTQDAVDSVDSNVVDNRVKEASRSRRATQLMSKAISRISTEYRLQFAWPGGRRQQQPQQQQQQTTTTGVANEQQQQQQHLTNGDVQQQEQHTKDEHPTQRKSTMGAMRQSSIMAATPAAVHKRRPPAGDHRRPGRDGGQASELEPLVQETDEHDHHEAGDKQQHRSVRIAEDSRDNRDKPRPFSAVEVMELRRELKRLADEYKHRDWGGVMAQEDEASLWKRVSTNHALDALSLARSATKEEKDKENTRKVVPPLPIQQQLAAAGRPSSQQNRPPAFFTQDDNEQQVRMGRARRDFLIRHHLERTTGADDGALLVSPTREKLEPVIPRRREESAEPTPRSKSSPKSSPRAARSQSVGPGLERRSPKRSQTRPASGLAKDAKDKDSSTERHQRPNCVIKGKGKVGQLTASSRRKTNNDQSVSVSKSRSRSVSARRLPTAIIKPRHKPSLAMTVNAPLNRPPRLQSAKPLSRPRSLLHQPTASSAAKTATTASSTASSAINKQAMTAEPQVNGSGSVPVQPQPQQRGWIDDEPVVKSPPEPTRVKSPEQMIMRSPEPVNWTVPLDTGKTFTVTQNVREGEPPTRAHSEARSWGGPTSQQKQQSAEHKLQLQQQQQQQQQQSGYKSPESESVSLGSFSGTNGHKDDSLGPERTASPLATIAKDEVEQQEQPAFEAKKDDLLDKARDRFDKFWGSKGGPEQ